MMSQWLRQSTLPSTRPNSSPVDSCLLQEKQAKQARWYTLPRALRTQSLAYTCRPHWAHLVPNLLWGRKKEVEGWFRLQGPPNHLQNTSKLTANQALSNISSSYYQTSHRGYSNISLKSQKRIDITSLLDDLPYYTGQEECYVVAEHFGQKIS